MAYASFHGGTADAAKKMAEILKAKGAKKVAIADLNRDKEILVQARYDAFNEVKKGNCPVSQNHAQVHD